MSYACVPTRLARGLCVTKQWGAPVSTLGKFCPCCQLGQQKLTHQSIASIVNEQQWSSGMTIMLGSQSVGSDNHCACAGSQSCPLLPAIPQLQELARGALQAASVLPGQASTEASTSQLNTMRLQSAAAALLLPLAEPKFSACPCHEHAEHIQYKPLWTINTFLSSIASKCQSDSPSFITAACLSVMGLACPQITQIVQLIASHASGLERAFFSWSTFAMSW